ncbi:hypothetical protein SARC_09492 [Sphaeroforma arctica JP610]|uniref:Metallo-beta-lactamase domain-containing protein n=1 Tax=Sphaeroforma arctica JP610 TaxID=667725 RepID=A0A0L0FPZ8_9EUKA|nr:hypothetical protein SARC_09492 [Sphaeroforma arctica JP610]KNC78058.1 hypothetical protein SARC_09492 [Sphaeroforma arctica JP610]|eukprot:XP_014151960.1 hypothetical protein SARC_09492 [Sphaeroforma arctica JP610]
MPFNFAGLTSFSLPFVLSSLLAVVALAENITDADTPCIDVVLTGTMAGPFFFGGLAGAGTLVSIGTKDNNCSDYRLQFDIGRGTSLRLSELGLAPNNIDALFLTHMHSDHTEDFTTFALGRWMLLGEPYDVVCSEDVDDISCTDFVEHIADAFEESGEIEQRITENAARNSEGPSALANVMTFETSDKAESVWKSADGTVEVTAIRTEHIGGSAAFRIDSPAGSVVIGGDAANDLPAEDRPYSTSDNVEALAEGADILVHSAIHPVMSLEESTLPAAMYNKFSTTVDIGAMAQRAGVHTVILTHTIPPLGAVNWGAFAVPGGEALKEDDYESSVKEGGFNGTTKVGTYLQSTRL